MRPWTGRRTRLPAGTRSWRWVIGPLALLLASGMAHGMEPDPPERHPLEMLAAHAVARTVLVDLKLAESPTKDDFRIATNVLLSATALLPRDQTLLRLRMEAAENAGDETTVREIARTLVALDPGDTVALLRVISGAIGDLQTVDERLAAYGTFLGDAGRGIDASVRSRLALDAALLYRERGDVDRFAAMLSQAVELDPTNKDAAMLALAFYTQRVDDPVGRFELLLLTVLKADPFDQATLAACVRELNAGGAPDGAWRFARLLRVLASSRQLELSSAQELAIDIAEWNAAGPEAVFSRLSGMLERERSWVNERRRQLLEAGLPVDTLPTEENVRLAPDRERVRVLSAAAMGDAERSATTLRELAASTQQAIAVLTDPTRRPSDIDENQAEQLRLTMLRELVWLRLWTGLDLPEAAQGLDELVRLGTTDPAMLRRFGAWRLLRAGESESARRALEAGADDPMCELGLAVLAEKTGDKAEAVRRYFGVMRRVPGELADAYARTRIRAIAGRLPALSEEARQLEAMAADVPIWLEEMVESPRRVMSLDVRPLRSEINAVERTPLRVTLRNISPIPLALGADKPISSRLMFVPVIDLGSARLPGSEYVHIVAMDRRLRLERDESVEAIVWPDLGALSYDLEWVGSSQARIRWRVLQGFEISPQRLFEPGPGSISAETAPLLRSAPSRTSAVVDALRRAIEVAGPRELSDTLQSLKLQIANPNSELEFGDLDRLIELLARRFSSMDRATKILVLSLLPPSRKVQPCLRVDQMAAEETDEQVLAVLIGTRVFRADDPLLSLPAVLNTPRLTELANLVKRRIEEDRPGITTRDPMVPKLIAASAPRHEPRQSQTTPDQDPAASASGAGSRPGGSPPENETAPKPPERVLPPAVPPDPAPVPMIF